MVAHPQVAISSQRSRPELVRALGVWSATALTIGAMIGTAIFLVPAEMAQRLGSARMVILVWIVGGALTLLGALTYAELGAAFPTAGGEYVYVRRGFNPALGFLFGWMKSFIGSPASIATVAAGFCRFLSVFLPKLNHPVLRWQVSLPHSNPHQLVLTVAQLLAAGLIVSVTFINYLGVRLGGRVQITFTSMKVAALVAIIIAALSAHSHLVSDSSTVITPAGFGVFGAFLTALVPVMWAYNGWSDLAQVGGEIADPQRNVPRALIGGVVAVAALYVMANVAYFHVLSVRQIASSTHVASDVVAAFSGARAARWITVAMMLSAFGTLNENLLALPRVPYAMASDGIFFHFCGQVSERFRTPWGGLLFTGLTAALLALTGTYEELYSLVIFALWIFHALTAVALIRLRQTEPELERPYRTLGYPAVPILFCAVGTIFTVNLWMVRPVRSSIGALAILSGLLFYRSWQKQNVNEVKNQLA